MALALTETVLFYWDRNDLLCRQSNQTSAKDDWAEEIKNWAEKVTSSKSLHTLLSQRSSTTQSRHARSISHSDSLTQGPCGTLATSSTRASPPSSGLTASESQPEECDSYVQGDDQLERNSLSNPTLTNTMDITEIFSGLELDESGTSPLPVLVPCSRTHSKRATTNEGNTKSQKRVRHNEDEPGAPPSKRMKTPRSTSVVVEEIQKSLSSPPESTELEGIAHSLTDYEDLFFFR
ncbi:hypothetical protein HD554DRAFT_2121150 [Boletus coccyginus]|nr:hypothetical protein HD554DRAFT_2121150 [Boletus coccyginus]